MITTQTEDRGLGTTYERFAIYRWLETLPRRLPDIQTVLEGPGDGVAGIPGIHGLVLARRNCQVIVALEEEAGVAVAQRTWEAQGLSQNATFLYTKGLPLPLSDQCADLVWNFNRLPFKTPKTLLEEMCRLSRRYVALIVPNRMNYGFPARRLYHWRTGEPWEYGNTEVMSPKFVRKLLSEIGMNLIEMRWIDVAWWPDIIDPVAWLNAMVPGTGRLLSKSKSDGYRWMPETLPYFDPAQDVLHKRMDALAFLERWPVPKRPFAHHFAVLAEKDHADT